MPCNMLWNSIKLFPILIENGSLKVIFFIIKNSIFFLDGLVLKALLSGLEKGGSLIEVYRTKVVEDNQHNWVFFI